MPWNPHAFVTTINDLFKSDSKLKCVEFGGGGVVGRGLFSFWAFLKGKGGGDN